MTDKQRQAWAKRLMDNYKLTIEQWEAMHAHQGGVCYVCREPEPVKGRRLAVDHNHTTGEIRGLLCSRCNPVLGKIERAYMRFGLGNVLTLDVVKWLVRMGQYMAQHPARIALGQQHIGYVGRVGTKAHRDRLRKEKRKSNRPRTPIERSTRQ